MECDLEKLYKNEKKYVLLKLFCHCIILVTEMHTIL